MAHPPVPFVFRAVKANLLLMAGVFLISCSPHRDIYAHLENLSREGQYEEAVKLIESKKETYGEKNEVVYHLDLGLYQQLAGHYQESNASFDKAEKRMDELYTESITTNVAAFASNDNTLPYEGEDHEKVLVNVYQAMNYAALGDMENALVEARKVDQKLTLINSHYPEDQKSVYREDAFARMLMGVFYEASGSRDDLNDAFISDRKAVGVYQKLFTPTYGTHTPRLLAENYISTAQFMGRQETEEAKNLFPGIAAPPPQDKRKMASVYFIHYLGRGPVKQQQNIDVLAGAHYVRVAYPIYTTRGYTVTGSRVLVNGNAKTYLALGEPVGAIAVKVLEDKKPRILAKATARAASKAVATSVASHAAGNNNRGLGALAFVAGTVYAVASEQADLRAWETLPDRILIGRVLLPPGEHNLSVEFLDAANQSVDLRNLGDVTLKAGASKFVILHSAY